MVKVSLKEEFTTQDFLKALSLGEVDVAMYASCGLTQDDAVEHHEWMRDRLVALVPVGQVLARSDTVELERLMDEELIGMNPGSAIMVDLKRAARNQRRALRLRFNVTSFEAAQGLVAAGLGVAIQPFAYIGQIEPRRIAPVQIEGPWAERSYLVGHARGRPLSDATRLLVEHLVPPPGVSVALSSR